MFFPIENGSEFEVKDNSFGFIFKCQLAPIGYGKDVMTGEIKKTDVLKSSEIPEQQKLFRITLPSDYKERRLREQQIQKINKKHVDYYLEEFRKKEWNRRLCGVWFWRWNKYLNKNECVYMTGQHWLYYNWWVYQGKYMDYREPDRETFYVAAYCQEDARCLGLNEITQRKSGKTGRSGCIGYERTSRFFNHHCGLQSKTDKDGETMFKKAMVGPWRKLPHFYRPVYDLMKGDDPSVSLSFFATSRRGQSALDEEPEDALDSFIDVGTSEEGFYDGPELHTYISDETGKTRRQVSVKERMRVVREATEIEGEIRGFHMSTTTVEVEKDETENEEFQEFTAQSNPLDRDDNGMTTSGYYTLFQPCTKYMYFDDQGFPDEERALTYVMNRRKKLEEEGDLRGLSSYKRKKPITFKEAFSVDGAFSLYNPELINPQLDTVSWSKNIVERGDLVWVGGFKVKKEIEEVSGQKKYVPSKVMWVANPKGKFEKAFGWMPKEENKVFERGGKFYPNNNFSYKIGCDPFKYDKTKDKRRSNCAAYVYQIADDIFPSEFDDTLVLKYAHRKESTRLANEDVLKMAWWCGCEVLFERNVNHWKNDFIDWECAKFLTWLPGEVEPGIVATPASIQTICNYTEAYINEHITKVRFKSLLTKDTGWLGFKVEDTEKFDEPCAVGYCLIAVKGLSRKGKVKKMQITDIFPTRKAS